MAHSHSTETAHHPASGATEPDHINVRAVAGFAIGLAVVAAAAHVAMLLMFSVLADQADASNPPRMYPMAPLATEPAYPGDPSGTQPPEPRLQTDPKQDLANLRAGEDEVLNGYGWVDRNNNVVRIPIETAIKLTLQRGLPSRSATEGQPAAPAQPAATPPATQGREQGK
jgi:hypothetical protein